MTTRSAKPTKTKNPNRPRTRRARVAIPTDLHRQLRHLAVDGDRTVASLLVEGAWLLLEQRSLCSRTASAEALVVEENQA